MSLSLPVMANLTYLVQMCLHFTCGCGSRGGSGVM